MKKTAYLVVAAVLLCAAPSFAQGPFNDVPTDHWAYDAVNTLQKDGIVIGYPDGTYGGKRAMSRYEFAVAIARLLPMIPSSTTTGAPAGFVTNEQLNKALGDYAKKTDVPDISKFATKADVDAIRKLVDEFRDEIAALGVDVDALKRDVAALAARVDAIEAEQKRVRFTGDVNVFAITTVDRKWDAVPITDGGYNGTMADLDERDLYETTMSRNIAVVRDFDLNIVGRVSDTVTANATITYGNYLSYLGGVDDYVGGYRPTSSGEGLEDDFFPYYLYIDAAMGKNGRVTVGRFPLQFTPYTLKKIDVDSYTSILKTDDGNYPVDGALVGWKLGGVDLSLFAAKHDSNDYLWNGLTGQPNSGLYRYGTFHVLGGNAVGGLENPITQSAGVRAVYTGQRGGSIGATFYQAWSKDEFEWESDYDQARVWGADINVPIGSRLGLVGSWTRSDTLARDGATVDDIDDDNTAWDAKLTAGLGNVGLGVGYKRIESNFAAAGAWDKIGRWTNPTNVKGPYADVTWPIGSNLSMNLNGEFLQMIDVDEDVDIIKAEGGLKWAFSKKNSLDVSYEWVKYKPDTVDDARESYLTLGWAHQMNPNAGFKVGYQFINWDGGDDRIAYGPDYRARVAVVEFGVTF